MKYKSQIEALLRELFYEDWMDENDYNELISLTLNDCGITFEVLNEQMEVGVKNGYSPEVQIKLLKDALYRG